MDMGVVRGLITGVLLVLFVWLTAWAWNRRRAPAFDAASNVPLEEDTQ